MVLDSTRLLRRSLASCLMAIAFVGIIGRVGLAHSDGRSHPPQNFADDAIAQAHQPSESQTPSGIHQEVAGSTQSACSLYLQSSIERIIQRPTFQTANWGILIESLDNETKLYSHNDNNYFIPASNIKLLTTAAALQSLHFSNNNDLFAFHRWIHVTNRDSNNRYADALLRRLGGPQPVSQALSILGIDSNGYRQVDGSGLSRYNMAKPKTFTDVLKAMTDAPGSNIFQGSLPVAGYSGTLRHRFRGTSAQGIVRAKTGTLRGVRALSGYLEHPQQGTIVFSILVNQANQSGSTMLDAIDDIVLQMLDLESCE